MRSPPVAALPGMKLPFTPQAGRQAAEIDFAGGSTVLDPGTSSRESWPRLGRRIFRRPGRWLRTYSTRSGKLFRRVLMPKTKNHLYFEVDVSRGQIIVHAIGGAPRGRGPKQWTVRDERGTVPPWSRGPSPSPRCLQAGGGFQSAGRPARCRPRQFRPLPGALSANIRPILHAKGPPCPSRSETSATRSGRPSTRSAAPSWLAPPSWSGRGGRSSTATSATPSRSGRGPSPSCGRCWRWPSTPSCSTGRRRRPSRRTPGRRRAWPCGRARTGWAPTPRARATASSARRWPTSSTRATASPPTRSTSSSPTGPARASRRCCASSSTGRPTG